MQSYWAHGMKLSEQFLEILSIERGISYTRSKGSPRIARNHGDCVQLLVQFIKKTIFHGVSRIR